MAYLTQTEYGKRKGISQQRISYMVKQGKLDGAWIQVGKRKLIIPDKADAVLQQNLDPVNQKADLSEIQNNEAKGLVKQAGTSGLTYHKARTLHEQIKAAIAKLDYDIKLGKYLVAEDVKKKLLNIAIECKGKILAYPSRGSEEISTVAIKRMLIWGEENGFKFDEMELSTVLEPSIFYPILSRQAKELCIKLSQNGNTEPDIL